MGLLSVFILALVASLVHLSACHESFEKKFAPKVADFNSEEDEGDFTSAKPFLAAFSDQSSHRTALDVKIFERKGDLRTTGTGDFVLHENAILLDERAHHVLDIRYNDESDGYDNDKDVDIKRHHHATVHSDHEAEWPQGAVVIGTHSHTGSAGAGDQGSSSHSWLSTIKAKGGHRTLRVRGDDHKDHVDGVLYSHRVVGKKKLTADTHEIELKPIHPYAGFRKIDMTLNSTRVATLAKKSAKEIQERVAGGWSPGTMSQCTASNCDVCDEMGQTTFWGTWCDQYTMGDGEEFAWCWGTAYFEACAEYEKVVTLLNVNYNTVTGSARQQEYTLDAGGVSGVYCYECYAFIGGGVGVELHYDAGRVWEASAHVWGATKMNFQLKFEDPGVSSAVGTDQTLFQGNSYLILSYSGYINVYVTPAMSVGLRSDSALSMTGGMEAYSNLDASFVLGIEETAPYIYRDLKLSFTPPGIRFDELFAADSDSSDMAVVLNAGAPLELVLGSTSFGLTMRSEVGVRETFGIETSFSPSRRRLAGAGSSLEHTGELQVLNGDQDDQDGGQLTLFPGATVTLSLADFVEVRDTSYFSPIDTKEEGGEEEDVGVLTKTRMLDVTLKNDLCFGPGVDIAVRSLMIVVPVDESSSSSHFDVRLPRDRIFSRCFGQPGQDSYLMQINTITGVTVYISQNFTVAEEPEERPLGIEVDSIEDFHKSTSLRLKWDPSSLAYPMTQSKETYKEMVSVTPDSARLICVYFNSSMAVPQYYDEHFMNPLMIPGLNVTMANDGAFDAILPPKAVLESEGESLVRLFVVASENTAVSIAVATLVVSADGGIRVKEVPVNALSDPHSHLHSYIRRHSLRSIVNIDGDNPLRLKGKYVRTIAGPVPLHARDRRRLDFGSTTCVTPASSTKGYGGAKGVDVNILSTFNLMTSSEEYTTTLTEGSGSSSCIVANTRAPTASPTIHPTVQPTTFRPTLAPNAPPHFAPYDRTGRWRRKLH